MKLAAIFGRALTACASMATFPHFALAQQEPIPDQFHGLWQITEEGVAPSCSPIDADIRMQVMSDRIDFHEGGCDVLSMDRTGNENEVALGLICWQEGEEWRDRQVWTLTDDGNRTVMLLNWLDRDFSTTVYGQCSVVADAANASGDTCYENSNSTLKIAAVNDTEVRIEVDSVQGGLHMCNLGGVGNRVPGGIRYVEQIDGAGECRLDIIIAEDGSVRIQDEDTACKNYYCGVRAALEHIQFGPNDLREC